MHQSPYDSRETVAGIDDVARLHPVVVYVAWIFFRQRLLFKKTESCSRDRDRRIMIVSLLATTLQLVAINSAPVGDEGNVNACQQQKRCGQCISLLPVCHWCLQKDFTGSHRCDLVENLMSNNCTSVYGPHSSILYYRNDPPRDADTDADAVQLAPQNVHINLRPNQVYRFPMTFRLAENYPVDLYFLMDVSRTMRSYKDNLVALSDRLAEELRKLTKNYRLGLGTFVDKTTMPYVSLEEVRVWCSDCAAPYGFRNHLRLISNVSEFRRIVNETEMSGNLDAPEGGFDAIMQVVACKKKIGWRSQSRKLVVMSTDASFHYAGDGKLGGIVEPNDGKCHIDDSGEYTETVKQDYPSISQLSQKVAEKRVHVVFAVPQRQVDIYHTLATFIEGSTVGVLTDTSGNVVDLIRSNYERISSSIEMKSKNHGDISVSFYSKCLGNVMRKTARCDGLHIGQNVTFDVRLEVKSCSQDPEQWSNTIQIHPVGIEEKLTATVFVDCECPCERPESEEPNSPACSGNGTYECGVCDCDDGYYGDRCQCDETSVDAETHHDACRVDNASAICTGHGRCECGRCVCDAISKSDPELRYSGDFCQCNNHNCDYHDGRICGGEDRGRCVCGRCVCNDEYNGTRCECPTSQLSCIATNGKLCNDKGNCVCGECNCTADNGFYKGPTCEDCPICKGKCEQTSSCARCALRTSPDLCTANCTVGVQLVDSVQGSDEWHACHVRDDDYCFIHFAYNYDTEEVRVQRTKECRKPVDVKLIVLGVVIGILVVGLLALLAWKAVVTVHDRREFARFQEEFKKSRWNVQLNPIYRDATTTYKNPTFSAAQ